MRKFLRSHGLAILCVCACLCLFAAVFALYGLPLMAIVYPAMLSAVLLLVAGICHGLWQRKKHRALQALGETEPGLIAERLPLAGSRLEEEYQALVCGLAEKMTANEQEAITREEAMEEYYSTWVHQMKTPIAAMRLKLQAEDSALARSLGADLTRIEEYTDMVMAYVRLSSPSTDYVLKKVDLDAVIRAAVRGFRGEFILRRLALHYTPVQYTVVSDEKWLAFVMGQILSNALKYTREGGITIAMEKPGVLAITDTGIGIAPEDVPRIFEKGFTGLPGRSGTGASGIGLYLCGQICRRLGHGIGVTSTPGQGSTFFLDFSADLTKP